MLGGAAVVGRWGAAGGGGDRSGRASLPGRATRSGLNFPVASALRRLSKSVHRNLYRLSNA